MAYAPLAAKQHTSGGESSVDTPIAHFPLCRKGNLRASAKSGSGVIDESLAIS
jgi:hypothetical protein